MINIYNESIVPLSELRSDLDKVKSRLKRTPVVITVNGRPDFGVCDLETLEIAVKIKELRGELAKRYLAKDDSEKAESVFHALEMKYRGKK
jgi:PHD/YefM family antitoxin component YafN of YafNO toxin-antitoxin module